MTNSTLNTDNALLWNRISEITGQCFYSNIEFFNIRK